MFYLIGHWPESSSSRSVGGSSPSSNCRSFAVLPLRQPMAATKPPRALSARLPLDATTSSTSSVCQICPRLSTIIFHRPSAARKSRFGLLQLFSHRSRRCSCCNDSGSSSPVGHCVSSVCLWMLLQAVHEFFSYPICSSSCLWIIFVAVHEFFSCSRRDGEACRRLCCFD